MILTILAWIAVVFLVLGALGRVTLIGKTTVITPERALNGLVVWFSLAGLIVALVLR